MTKHLRPHPHQKQGRIKPPPDKGSTNPEHPVFCLKHMVDPHYCVTACSKDQQAALAQTLYKLSQLTWSDIASSGRHANGHEKLSQAQINGRFPDHITPEVTMIAFRFSGKAPMVGYRHNEVFHIIWLDHNFTLYDHG